MVVVVIVLVAFFISGIVDYMETSLVTRHRKTRCSFWQRICMCVCLRLSLCACAYECVVFVIPRHRVTATSLISAAAACFAYVFAGVWLRI